MVLCNLNKYYDNDFKWLYIYSIILMLNIYDVVKILKKKIIFGVFIIEVNRMFGFWLFGKNCEG